MEEMDFTGITSENCHDEQWQPYMSKWGWAAFYDPDTGQINWALRLTLAEIVINHLNAGSKPFIGLSAEPDSEKQMVQAGALVDRPTMSVSLDGNVLRGVPVGAEVYVNGDLFMAEESDILIDAPEGEALNIRVDCWPYISAEFEYAGS